MRSAALRLVLRIIDADPSVSAGPTARIGAVAFIHQFGASLNEQIHSHICVAAARAPPVWDREAATLDDLHERDAHPVDPEPQLRPNSIMVVGLFPARTA